ncbi:helix-turn-helix domain-containing protein [Gluconobacter cerinus]|uniref:helix-turn-helix domain-containing protein n=1 Tax=Gluconobacter cerinus TaxID=38307 RepID=UPI001BBAB451|nr:helix-turn-helix transcriptional regulator [Gluconobacter cerinus]
MSNLTEVIAKKVFSARSVANLDILELSRLSDLSPEVITLVEDGKYRPTPEELIRLTDALNVKPSDLLS